MRTSLLLSCLFASAAHAVEPALVFAKVSEDPFHIRPTLRLEQDACFTWGPPSVTSAAPRELRVTQAVTPIAGCTGGAARAAAIELPDLETGAWRLTYEPQPVGFGPMPVSVVEFTARPPQSFLGGFIQEPYEPLALEPVQMHMTLLTGCDAIAGMRLVGGAIRIELDRYEPNAFVCDTGHDVSYTIGAFPPGTYRVELAYLPEDGGALVDALDLVVRPGAASTPAERGQPVQDLSGLWHSPNEEPSTGITFLHVREPTAPGETFSRLRLLGIWYRYDAAGNATWYWIDAPQSASATYAGVVYAYREADPSAPGFRRTLDAVDAGSLSIRFGTVNEPARVSAVIDGAPLEFAVQRFRFQRAAWPAQP